MKNSTNTNGLLLKDISQRGSKGQAGQQLFRSLEKNRLWLENPLKKWRKIGSNVIKVEAVEGLLFCFWPMHRMKFPRQKSYRFSRNFGKIGARILEDLPSKFCEVIGIKFLLCLHGISEEQLKLHV